MMRPGRRRAGYRGGPRTGDPTLRAFLTASEAAYQMQIRNMLVASGFRVWVIDQGAKDKAARRDAGVADIEAIHKQRKIMLKIETKTPIGEAEHQRMIARPLDAKMSTSVLKKWKHAHAQEEYAAAIRSLGPAGHPHVRYVRGGPDEVLATLQALGFLTNTARLQP